MSPRQNVLDYAAKWAPDEVRGQRNVDSQLLCVVICCTYLISMVAGRFPNPEDLSSTLVFRSSSQHNALSGEGIVSDGLAICVVLRDSCYAKGPKNVEYAPN